MSIKKILAFTSIRSDYDLMSGLYSKLNKMDDFEVSLIVSGAHLSESYGYTVKNIEKDGIPILAKIETLIDSDSRSSRLKSLSILLQNCIHNIVMYNPDLIIYAGDREDVIVGGIIGAYLRIPTVHFFGGDHAIDGNVDNIVRHATSKLSSIHFVSNEDAKERLISLGENKNRIFNVGSPSLDKFIMTESICKDDIVKIMNKEDWDEYAVLIFHPNSGEEDCSGKYFEQILMALERKKVNAFVSYPNIDSGNKEIIKIIDKYKNNNNFKFYKNLSRDIFINLLRNCKFMIGNSSAGLYESPIIKKPAINVGNRQKGRLATDNVLFINEDIDSICNAIDKAESKEFLEAISSIESPYGDGKSIDKIIDLLMTLDYRSFKIKYEDPLLLKLL